MIAGNIVVRIGADLSGFSEGLKKAGKEMKAASKELTSMGKSLTMGVTAPIVGAGAAAFQMAADMQDAMGATNQIFGDSADGMIKWSKSLSSSYGIASGEAMEYGNMMGSMLQNIGGLTEEQAAKQAQDLIKLAGDLTAMYGGTTQDAVQALTGALKGNNTMLDNYGMAVNDAMVKTKAFEMGLYSGKGEMDLATKQAATLALITEQSAAAQGQAAREAGGASGAMRSMTTELKNLATSFGEILLPVITPFIAKVNELVQWFGQLDQKTKEHILTVLGITAVIGPAILILGSFMGAIVNIITVGKTLTTVFTGIKALFSIIPTILSALMGPLGLVILKVGALIAAGVLLYQNWDLVKVKASELADGIKSAFSSVKDFVLDIWDGIVSGIKGSINKIIDAMNGLIRGMNRLKWDAPDWVPLIGGKKWGINLPEIPRLASGGVVDSPTVAMIGEAGPEAVIPLDKLNDILRSVTGKSNGSQNINLTVTLDGKVLARQTYDYMQQEGKIRGSSLLSTV